MTCNAPEGGGIVFKVSKDGKVTGSRHRVLLSLAVTNAALEEIVEREAFLAARRSRGRSASLACFKGETRAARERKRGQGELKGASKADVLAP